MRRRSIYLPCIYLPFAEKLTNVTMNSSSDTELLECPECGRTTTGVLRGETGGVPFTPQTLAVHRFRARRVQNSTIGPGGHTYSGPPLPGYPEAEPPPILVSIVHADTPTFSHIESLSKLNECLVGLEERELVYVENATELEAEANRFFKALRTEAVHPESRGSKLYGADQFIRAESVFERARRASEISSTLKQLVEVYNIFGEDLGSKIAVFHIALRKD